ncbi:MAG: DNRLRE domain-containing protein [Clostridia bacterium]|nr:DNRLRE domain-containing protein [Clostridia bacterium]
MANIVFTPAITKHFSNVNSRKKSDGGVIYIGVDGNIIYRAICYFDTNILYSDIELDSAVLRMYAKAFEENVKTPVTPYMVTSSWNEDMLDWDHQPSFESSVKGNSVIVSKDGWYKWNITEIIKSWIDYKHFNYGILLKTDEHNSNDIKMFYSQRNYYYSRQSPVLEIRYKFKNPFSLNSRNSISLFEEHTTTEIFMYTTWVNVSMYSTCTYFVHNTGSETATVHVQVSPDKNAILDEEAIILVEPGSTKSINPMHFSYFCRLAFKSYFFRRATGLKIWFQAQV